MKKIGDIFYTTESVIQFEAQVLIKSDQNLTRSDLLWLKSRRGFREATEWLSRCRKPRSITYFIIISLPVGTIEELLDRFSPRLIRK